MGITHRSGAQERWHNAVLCRLQETYLKDVYPLPRIDDTLTTLAGSQWFTTLDMISGYWQVGLSKGDREKTAFCTTEGLYEFRVMPFGLYMQCPSNISTPNGSSARRLVVDKLFGLFG